MMPLLHRAILLMIALAAIGCSESMPTAPSAVDPTASASMTPVPAPVSQTLTGTWTGAGQKFTVTQNGSSATGMSAPATTDLGNGVTLTESAMIAGTVSGLNVTLQMNERVIINESGTMTTCAASHSFTGALSGNTLSGTMAVTSPLSCGGASPSIVVPQVSGPVTYTRQ